MPYYDTIGEDIERAKQILAKGKPDIDALQRLGFTPENLPTLVGGAIYGADAYAAYRLLESFVDQVESYQLLLALMHATDFRAAVLAWKMAQDQIERLERESGTP
jgi:hypothetical protein